MDNLRLTLIILGVIIIIAIYLWERYQRKQELENYRSYESDYDTEEERLVITTSTKFDDDLTSELADLKNFMGDPRQTSVDEDVEPIFTDELFPERDDDPEPDSELISEIAEKHVSAEQPVSSYKANEEESLAAGETIIILHVVATDGNSITGNQLLTVAEQLGFEFGEMNIFHYYDNANETSRQSLFSLVNMYEPGSFDMQAISEFSTSGVSIFAKIENDSSAQEIFDSMLAVTKHLAQLLDCSVLGPDRQALTDEMIGQIQNQIMPSQE